MRLSLVKTKDNAALPSAKKGIITLIHADQIIAMPETDEKGIRCVNELKLVENAELQYLYLTPFTQKEEISPSGEVESTLFLPKVSGTYPGNKIGAAEFLKQNINEPFIMIYDDCSENSGRIYGTKYQPMYMKPDYKSDSTGKLWNFTFEQSEATDTPYLYYEGPAVNNLQIVGRNLIKNYNDGEIINLYGIRATRSVVKDDSLPSKSYVRFNNIQRQIENYVFYLRLVDNTENFNESLVGKLINVSFYIRANNSQRVSFERDSGNIYINADTTWKRLSFSRVYDTGNYHFFMEGLDLTSFDIHSVKIEYGNKPTDWIPAPEDIII